MSGLPQPTSVLVKRLRRVAKDFDGKAESATRVAQRLGDSNDAVVRQGIARLRASANTCWQAAGRLEDLSK